MPLYRSRASKLYYYRFLVHNIFPSPWYTCSSMILAWGFFMVVGVDSMLKSFTSGKKSFLDSFPFWNITFLGHNHRLLKTWLIQTHTKMKYSYAFLTILEPLLYWTSFYEDYDICFQFVTVPGCCHCLVYPVSFRMT